MRIIMWIIRRPWLDVAPLVGHFDTTFSDACLPSDPVDTSASTATTTTCSVDVRLCRVLGRFVHDEG
jgi:hypothetical protein